MNKSNEHNRVDVGTGNYICIDAGKVKVVTARGWVDWPIFENGKVSYICPNKISQRVMQAVKKYFEQLSKSQAVIAA